MNPSRRWRSDPQNAVLVMRTQRARAVEAVDTGEAMTTADVARARRDVTFATELLRRGVETLLDVSGANAVYDRDPLQSLVRDVLTIATHTVVSHQGAMVPYGRLLLGLPPTGGEG